MTDGMKSFLKAAIRNQDGQILPWMALLTVLFLGMAGLTLDLGHAYVSYRELQASTDAAALAGAYEMSVPTSTVASVDAAAKSASSVTGNKNVNINLPSANLATPVLKCVTGSVFVTVPCDSGPTGYNVIQVTQSAVVPTMFIRALAAFGINSASSITLSTTSTAAMQNGGNKELNLVIIVDTTGSMNDRDNDASCNNTELYCALQGVRTMLGSLSPCTDGSTKGKCLGPYDQVSLFTFPNLPANDASDDTTCGGNSPPMVPYSYIPIPGATNTSYTAPTGTTATYQVTIPETDYSANNQANGGLNTTSPLGIASGADTSRNCPGMKAPGTSTYIAAAMYQAITSLQAQQAARPGSTNALVLLSDGGANSNNFGPGYSKTSGTYPSSLDQCQQTVAAGQYATSLGITVYTVAYGATTVVGNGRGRSGDSTCTTDTTISPCTEMRETASSPADFYSDATATEAFGECTSASNPNLNLKQIFNAITAQLTVARLIPNNVI